MRLLRWLMVFGSCRRMLLSGLPAAAKPPQLELGRQRLGDGGLQATSSGASS